MRAGGNHIGSATADSRRSSVISAAGTDCSSCRLTLNSSNTASRWVERIACQSSPKPVSPRRRSPLSVSAEAAQGPRSHAPRLGLKPPSGR